MKGKFFYRKALLFGDLHKYVLNIISLHVKGNDLVQPALDAYYGTKHLFASPIFLDRVFIK